jgi:hypothetical protein
MCLAPQKKMCGGARERYEPGAHQHFRFSVIILTCNHGTHSTCVKIGKIH